MEHVAWTIALAVMLAAPAARAQEAATDEPAAPTTDELARRERDMALDAQQAELAHAQQMRELELAERKAEVERMQRPRHRRDRKGGGVFLLWVALVHILVTVWVFKDMHEQKIGRALWVPIVLLTGVFGAILYAIVRNADLRGRPAGTSAGPGAAA